MKFDYDPETDSLYISWNGRASQESEEIADGVVVDFDDEGRVVGLDIEWASKKIDLTEFQLDGVPLVRLAFDREPARTEQQPETASRRAKAS